MLVKCAVRGQLGASSWSRRHVARITLEDEISHRLDDLVK
jgi:hypothetical protein